jgi:hypothetical protein
MRPAEDDDPQDNADIAPRYGLVGGHGYTSYSLGRSVYHRAHAGDRYGRGNAYADLSSKIAMAGHRSDSNGSPIMIYSNGAWVPRRIGRLRLQERDVFAEMRQTGTKSRRIEQDTRRIP